jgi:hypothetical protein
MVVLMQPPRTLRNGGPHAHTRRFPRCERTVSAA